MPWKLLLTLLIFTLFVAFTGFNLQNTSVISFGFTEFQNVPIFLSLSIAFLVGAFYSIPYVLFSKKKQPKPPKDKDSSRSKKSGSQEGSGRKALGKPNRQSKETEQDPVFSREGVYLAEGNFDPNDQV